MLEKITDIKGNDNYVDFSRIIGITRNNYEVDGMDTNSYSVSLNTSVGYPLEISNTEAIRVVEAVNTKKTDLEEIKNDLGSLKAIDDLLKSIRS